MSLTLILTRHAKSDWGTPGSADFDRPLNDRGRRAATRIGAWLAASSLRPDEVIVSGARRTVETWAEMASAFDPAPPARTDRALYDAPAEAILAVLNRAQAPVTMLIGHNPGIGECARRLAIAAPPHPRFAAYPTGASTVLRFSRESWGAVGWGEGDVVDFVVPRELKD
jgi:phosphohistidine phosphatase